MGGFFGGMASAIGDAFEKKRDQEHEADKEMRAVYLKASMDPNLSPEARTQLADAYQKYLGPESKKGFKQIWPTIEKVMGLHKTAQQQQQGQPQQPQGQPQQPSGPPNQTASGTEAGDITAKAGGQPQGAQPQNGQPQNGQPQTAGQRALPAPQPPQQPASGNMALQNPMSRKQRQAQFMSAVSNAYGSVGQQQQQQTKEQREFELSKLDKEHQNKLEELEAQAKAKGAKLVGPPVQMVVDGKTKSFQRIQNSDGTMSLEELPGEPPKKEVNTQGGWAKTPTGEIIAVRINPRDPSVGLISTETGKPVPEGTKQINPSLESAEMRQWSYGRMGDLYRAAKGEGLSDDEAKKKASEQFRQKYLLDLDKEQQDIWIKEALSHISGATQTPGSKALPKPENQRSPITGLTPNDEKDVNYYISTVMGNQKGGGQAAAVASRNGQEALQRITGLNAMELNAALTEDKALGKTLGQVVERAGAYSGLQNAIEKHGQLLLDATKALDPTGSPLANRTWQWIENNVEAHPELSQYQIAIQAVQREYGKLVSGATMSRAPLHVAAIKEGSDTFKPDATMADIAASVEQLKKEAEAETESFKKTIGDIKAQYSGGAIGSALTPGSRALPPPKPSGTRTGTTNGTGGTPKPPPKTADEYLKSIQNQ